MLSVYVNTESKMSKEMLDALTRFEVCNSVVGKKTATESEVCEFLSENYGRTLADNFSLEMLLKAPNS